MSVQTYLAALEARAAFFESLVGRLVALDQQFERDLTRLRDLHERSRTELAAYLLADVDDEAIASLEARLRYPSLLPVKRRFDEALVEVHARIDEMAVRPEIQHGELHRREVQDELAELMPAYEVHERIEQIFTACPYFTELRERGWFDPRYRPTGYFERVRNWRAVSLLLEDLDAHLELFQRSEPFETPEEVRTLYNQHSETWSSVKEAVDDLRQRGARLDALSAEWNALQQRPRELFEALYRTLCQAVLDHLESCPEALRFELAQHDEHLTTFLKKVAGLRKQLSYLEQLRVVRVSDWLERARREHDKVARKVAKVRSKMLRYKPVAVTPALIDKTRNVKADAWDKRVGRLDETRERIATFNRYQKGSFTEDYLWWDVMTGRAHGDDLYEVRAFRERHPGWDHRSYSPPGHSGGPSPDAASLAVTALAIDQAADALAEDLSRPEHDPLVGDLS